ncbi:MAG: integrase [Gammaproteobacteria bacterium]|nr:MAG: integrase [Gammaproteobacteria bacterium]
MTPKKRNKARTSTPEHWPARWREHHGAIYYQVPPGHEGEWDGKKMYQLGKTEAAAWTTWYAKTVVADGSPRTMDEAFDRYSADVLPGKAPKTQKEYARSIKYLRAVFGHMPPAAIKPTHVYQYMDKRPPTAGNRDKATLSAVMTECVRWGALDRNLVREVKRNKETPRDRYVEDAELEAFKAFAGPMLTAYLSLRMLTGLRQDQILGLKRSDWDGKHLKAPGVKAGRTVIYTGEALIDAVNGLLALGRGQAASSMYLLSSRNGTRYSTDGFRSIWQRRMTKYMQATGGERFREHDLRAKVATDSKDLSTASTRLGHQSETTTKRVYRRKPATVHVLQPEESGE